MNAVLWLLLIEIYCVVGRTRDFGNDLPGESAGVRVKPTQQSAEVRNTSITTTVIPYLENRASTSTPGWTRFLENRIATSTREETRFLENGILTSTPGETRFLENGISTSTPGRIDPRQGDSTSTVVAAAFDDEATTTPASCPEIGEPADLVVETTSFNITLSWTPSSDCILQYAIYLDDTLVATISDSTYTIPNLDACAEYTVGLAGTDGPTQGPIVNRTVNTPVPEDFNTYPVENFQVNDTSDGGLTVSWEAPDQVSQCVTMYYLIWWDADRPNETLVGEKNIDAPATSLEIALLGCMNYSLQITPQVNASIPGKLASADYSARPTLPRAPQVTSSIHNSRNVSFTFQTEDWSQSRCAVEQIVVTCVAPEDQNGDYSWIIRNGKGELHEPEPSVNFRYTVTVAPLSPFTTYICDATVTNEAGDSNSTVITFATDPEASPAPAPITISEVQSRQFKIEWTEPDEVYGNLTNYNLTIEPSEPVPSCSDVTTYSVIVSAETTSHLFDQATPYYEYQVSVFGMVQDAGDGDPATATVRTESAEPDPVSNVQRNLPVYSENDTYKATVLIEFEPPCNTHGPFKNYIVSYRGARESFGDDVGSHVTNDTSVSVDLKPERNYTFEVMVMTEGFNTTVAAPPLRTDAGVPALNGDFTPPVTNETDKVYFTLSKNDFSNENGEIVAWAVILLTTESSTTSYGFWNGTWPEVPENGTQLHSDFWNPFVDTETVTLEINVTDKCSSHWVIVRALTSAAYRDSPLLHFRTETNTSAQLADPVYADTEKYEASVEITFQSPCNTTDRFKTYTVTYNGQRNSFANDTGTISTNDTSVVIGLEPERTYSFDIHVVSENLNSSLEVEPLVTKSGVPILSGNLTPPTVNDTDKAYFTLSKNVFSNDNGEIVAWALVLLTTKSDTSGYGPWDGTWPETNGTQLTPDTWNPFVDGAETVTFVIGSGTTATNKGLKDDTEYWLIVRARTSAAYKDSPLLHFQTEMLDALNLALILGLTFGLLALLALLIFLVFWWRRKRKSNVFQEEERRPSTTATASLAPIPLKKFVNYYVDIKENYSILKQQYTDLGARSKEAALPTTYATLPENRRKNRYTNILPFDDTRVKLKIDEDDEISSDYINASYIKGYSGKIEYIATQGPLEHTTRDFWKMILQENVSIIVMVSQFVEQSKEKCYQYFPNNHESVLFGESLEVKCSTELHFGTYCVRTLQVRKGTEQRHVIHMQFLEWPDFGVPQGTDNMLQFCGQLREKANSEGGLIVVHCSAGVGRTGTLIALDILLQTIDDHRDINIYKTVLDLRRQRTNMVQTEKQYMFIHTSIKEYIETPTIQSNDSGGERIYENLDVLRSSLNKNLIESDLESAL